MLKESLDNCCVCGRNGWTYTPDLKEEGPWNKRLYLIHGKKGYCHSCIDCYCGLKAYPEDLEEDDPDSSEDHADTNTDSKE